MTTPSLFYLLLNQPFHELLLYISIHSTLDHFDIILNLFLVRLQEDKDSPLSLSVPFVYNLIEKIVNQPFFFKDMVKITKNFERRQSRDEKSKLKQKHLINWILSLEIFESLCKVSISNTLWTYQQILSQLLLSSEAKGEESQSANFLEENTDFFEIKSKSINFFAFELFKSKNFTGHLFLLLFSKFVGVQVNREFLEE